MAVKKIFFFPCQKQCFCSILQDNVTATYFTFTFLLVTHQLHAIVAQRNVQDEGGDIRPGGNEIK